MTKLSRTTKTALALAALTSVGVTMVPADAEAGWRGRRNAAIGAGIVAGIAGAALLAGTAHAHGGYGYYRPAYAAPAYAPDCYWVRQRRETWDGYVVVRRVRVCD
jgi:predicted secreted Zn-dependent protease